MIVACPTVTPGTSAIVLRGPGGSTPQPSPRSRARISAAAPVPGNDYLPVRCKAVSRTSVQVPPLTAYVTVFSNSQSLVST